MIKDLQFKFETHPMMEKTKQNEGEQKKQSSSIKSSCHLSGKLVKVATQLQTATLGIEFSGG